MYTIWCIWTYLFTHVTITTIKVINISITSKSFLVPNCFVSVSCLFVCLGEKTTSVMLVLTHRSFLVNDQYYVLQRNGDKQPETKNIFGIQMFLPIFFFFFFVAVLGLRFCARAFSSCGEWGPLFIVVRGPLTVAASLAAEHRLQTHRLSSCGSRAQLLRGMWDLPRPELEPVSPALAGRFSTTAPPGKPPSF